MKYLGTIKDKNYGQIKIYKEDAIRRFCIVAKKNEPKIISKTNRTLLDNKKTIQTIVAQVNLRIYH